MRNLTPTQTIQAFKNLQRDPNKFFVEALGAECEEYQKEILRAIVEHDRVAISAAHNLGKSWVMARVVLWYATTHPYSKVITTAPTGRQVEKILWSEIRSAHNRAIMPLGGRMLTTEWKITEEGSWFALGFSPSSDAGNQAEGQGTQSNFQGFHSEHLMVIFDEATGVKPALWTLAEGLLTSGHPKFLCIANPTSTQSDFFRCFSDRAWHKIKLSCFDSPNLKANGITTMQDLQRELDYCRTLGDAEFLERVKSYAMPKSHMLTARWVIEKALDWGLESPLFMSKVLGEFPLEGENVAIPLRTVEIAQERRGYKPTGADRKVIGVDVARFGADSSVFTRMHGPVVQKKKATNKRDTMQTVGEVVQWCSEDMPDVIVVDVGGLGAGVVDRLVELRDEGVVIHSHVEVRGVNFGKSFDKSTNPEEHERFVNEKARMFTLLAEDMKNNIELLDEEVYQSELPGIQYRYDSRGRTYIESKDEFKKRTGRGSPDHADSLALANLGRYDEIQIGSFEMPAKVKELVSTGKPRSWNKSRGKVNY